MTDPINGNCVYPNYFSGVVAPAVRQRLPERDSFSGIALDHLTNVGPFVDTVSRELCEDGRIGKASAQNALGFITRSSTSTIVTGAALGLTGIGLVAGSPIAAIGAGIAGLLVLPPLVERGFTGVASFIGDLFSGWKARREQS
jgi:hypothetical protein